MIRRVLCALAAGGMVLASAAPGSSYAEDARSKKLFTIDDSRITESSGLAKSLKHPGVWWTINDSGDRARVFGIDAHGRTVAVLTYGATVRDVEAIGVGTDGSIYVADIGDNNGDRSKVTIYSMPEPDDLADQRMRYRAYDFAYPDGPHNAETLLVNPANNRLYIVTKGAKGAIYAAPETASRTEVNELTKVGTAPSIVTDGTFTADGKRILLRDYTSMIVMSWPNPKTIATEVLPPMRQGESIAIGPTASTVLISSDNEVHSPVYQVAIPASAGSAPTPSATPGKDGKANAAAPAGGQDHTMRWTLVGAGAFALLAAAFTFPVGRRERLDAMMERQRRRPAPPYRQRRPY